MADGPLKIQLVVDKAGPDLYCGRTGDFPDMVAVAPTIEGVIARAPYAMTEYLQANKIFGPVDLTVLVIRSFQVMVNPPAPPRPPGQGPAGQGPAGQGPRPPGAPGAPRPPGAPPAGGPRPPGAQAGGPRPPGAPGAKPGAPPAPPRPKIKMLTILPPGTVPLPPEAEEPTSPSAATTASTPTVAKP
jgi:hypothetical protein